MRRPTTRARGTRLLPFHRLDLSVTPGNVHEFHLWRGGMAPLFAMDAADAEARASFGAQLTSYRFADAAIISGHSSAATFERAAPLIARGGIDHISLLVYAKGGCRLDADGRVVEVQAGDVCFLDLSRPISLRSPDYESLTLILPRTSLEPYLADLDWLHGRILQTKNPLNALLVRHLRTMFEEAPALNATDGRAAANGTAALIAAFAGPSKNGRDAMARTASVASLNSIKRFVEGNLQDPKLGPDLICARLGVSRAKLYREFEPMGGVSQYILQRRLSRARQLFADPAWADQRVGAVATECGFGNVSVFNRAFRRAYGMSPTDLRDALVRNELPDLGFSGEARYGAMGRWLLGLDTI